MSTKKKKKNLQKSCVGALLVHHPLNKIRKKMQKNIKHRLRNAICSSKAQPVAAGHRANRSCAPVIPPWPGIFVRNVWTAKLIDNSHLKIWLSILYIPNWLKNKKCVKPSETNRNQPTQNPNQLRAIATWIPGCSGNKIAAVCKVRCKGDT